MSRIVEQGIGTALNVSGKSWQNGVSERLSGKLRDGCPGLGWFRSRAEAKVLIAGRGDRPIAGNKRKLGAPAQAELAPTLEEPRPARPHTEAGFHAAPE